MSDEASPIIFTDDLPLPEPEPAPIMQPEPEEPMPEEEPLAASIGGEHLPTLTATQARTAAMAQLAASSIEPVGLRQLAAPDTSLPRGAREELAAAPVAATPREAAEWLEEWEEKWGLSPSCSCATLGRCNLHRRRR